MGIRRRVRAILRHTRFVPTPVYRLMVGSWLISGILQLVYGAPNSVREINTGQWFDYAFVFFQLAAALAVIVGLYLVEENTDHARKLSISLTLELLGIIGIQTIIAIQVAASTYYQGRIPSAGTTWMGILFAIYLAFRQRDIIRAQVVLGRRSE